MNIIPIIITILIIVIIISVIIYIKYYKRNLFELKITGMKDDNNMIQIHKTIELNNIELNDFINKLQRVDSNMKVENDSKTIECTMIKFKDDISFYIFVNSLIDVLIESNITTAQCAMRTNQTKMIDNSECQLSSLYITQITDYKVIHVNSSGDVNIDSDSNTDSNDNVDSDSNADSDNNIDKSIEQFSSNEYHSSDASDFILYDGQNINATIIMKSDDQIYVIEFPIYTYSAYKQINEQLSIILEDYKGLIASKSITMNEIKYELHYNNVNLLKTDYNALKTQIERRIGTLIVYLNDQTYVYQTTDIAKLNRYIAQLGDTKLIKGDYNLTAARINSMKIFS
jgi:hypothetical protein